MTSITPQETQAVAQAGRLRGFSSGAREMGETAVQVEGELPAWLHGTLLLNGPALWDLPLGRYQHWFDGLAMLHAVRLGEDGASYGSRFLRSADYLESMAAQRPAKSGFGTRDRPGLWRRIRGIFSPDVTDNASVVMSRIGEQWVATTESPRMIGFDPQSLETTGELQFDDKVRLHLMAAHGCTDATGTYWNVGVELGPQAKYKLFRIRPGSRRREVVGGFTTKEAGYLHGFAMTPRHAVVWEPALRAQSLRFVFTGNAYMRNFEWKPEGGSMLRTISLEDGRVSSWTIPPMMCFHAVQAYESEGDVVLELAVFDDASVLEELMLEPLRKGQPLRGLPKLARYRLRPGASSAQPEFFGGDLELPQVNPMRWGAGRATKAWGVGAGGSGSSALFDRATRIDLATGDVSHWQRPNAIQLEPLFVARPGASGEEDGVLLVPTLADDDAGTVVAVLDPAAMKCLATLRLPQVVPFGFHAAWNGA
jgi:beta,beta-carotene 9',10'-dioxygenase